VHLKRIDIHGFKSFGDKSYIDFSPGITAIVGPNGSGKSNVADAVRWVLGEQSARALRGTKMEDVIFAGTNERRPLSYCEVILTFDNADGALPVEYSEVAVSRRLYRSGDSEYAINKSPCRMRDILSVFYDTGVGRDGYSIIGQGKIEEILSPKGEERRAAFEEAAGVMKYKVRKQEAQRKLSNVENSLIRVGDIMAELENSLEPLAAQAETAKEFLALQSRLKDLDITLFYEQHQRSTARIKKLDGDIGELERYEEESKAREADLREEEELHREKLTLMEGLLEAARDKRFVLAQKMNTINADLALSAQRYETAKENLARLLAERDSDEALLFEVLRTMEMLSGTREVDTKAAEDALNRDIFARDERKAKLFEQERLLDAKKQEHLDALAQEGEKKSLLARQAAIYEQAAQRLEQISSMLQAGQDELSQLEIEKAEAEQEGAGVMEALGQLEEQAKDAEAEYHVILERIQNANIAIAGEREKARGADHRGAIQRELKRNFEGYPQTIRLLMQDVREKAQPVGSGVYGPVGDLIKTDAKYEKAIGQALAASAQNIVVEDEETGKALISHLRRNDYGRATFLPLNAINPRVFGSDINRYLSMDGAIGTAMELIRCDDRVKKAAEYLLGRTLVVRDMDCGIAIARASGRSFRCVTLSGDLLNPGGTMTGGSNRDRGFLSRDRLIREADEEKAAALERIALYEKKKQELIEESELVKVRVGESQQALQQGRIHLAQVKEKTDAIVFQLERAAGNVNRLKVEEQRIRVMMDEAKPKAATGAAKDLQALITEIDSLSRFVMAERSVIDGMDRDIAERQINLSALLSEQTAAEKELMRLGRDRDRLQSTLASAKDEIEELEQKINNWQEERVGTEQALSELKTESDENDGVLDQLGKEKQRLEILTRAAFAKREELIGAAEENRDRRYRMGNQRERLLAELEALETRMWNDYEMTVALAEQHKLEIKISDATKEAGEIRRRITAMGPVNPGAIEEYSRVQERYSFLMTQSTDLEKAKADLTRLIDDLMGEMQKRFLDQFKIINENFKKTFRALFKGGEARLELSDENNAMDCNIDIIAQPPGKRLQNISLLSGGERALTAIAILFAMLDLKATPFCILDEIETALDDENLRLFADYLGNYKRSTQFIAITHRRPTMEAADALYGVTMEEKGVSKLVSVRFQDV